MTKLQIPVSYRPGQGYLTKATPALPKSVTALSLMVLRKRVLIAATKYQSEPIQVRFALDPSAQAENDRRRAAAGL